MDRKAFKQRMQNLKSYRGNNPGKGYWDWKLQSFADGGEVPPIIPSARKLKNAMPIPTVSRPFSKRIDELEAGYERVRNEYSQQLNDALESLIDNEDAFRKAANADKTSGTNYVKTYTDNLRNKANSPDKLPKPYILKAEPNKRAFVKMKKLKLIRNIKKANTLILKKKI